MKINITPNELKMLINDYELKIAMAKIEFYGNSHRESINEPKSSIVEMESRLEDLTAEYEVRLNDIKCDIISTVWKVFVLVVNFLKICQWTM